MEIKTSILDKLLCVACLCIGRRLTNISDRKLQQYYLDIISELNLYNASVPCPSLCWECMALLKKTFSFREQVKDSYRILQTYSNENYHGWLLDDIIRSSSLKIHHVDRISVEPSVWSDDAAPKVVDVKEEVKDEWEVAVVGSPLTNKVFPVVPLSDSKEQVEREEDPLSIRRSERKKQKKDAKEKLTKHLDTAADDIITEEFKNESEDTRDASPIPLDDSPPSPLSDSKEQAEIEDNPLGSKERKKRKKNAKDKIRNVKRLIKQLESTKSTKRLKTNLEHKIRVIEMSYEEMLVERAKDAAAEKYLKSEYRCESCIVGFNYLKSYEAHLASRHAVEIGDYSCPICNTVVPSVESFVAHYKRHMKRYECSICHKRATDLKVIQQHYYSSHEIALKQYSCAVCGHVSHSIDSHRAHCELHKPRVQCPQCDKTFSHRAGLMNHRLAVHESQNEFPCPECSKMFRWKTSLKRHMETHADKDKQPPVAYCCPCDISFRSVSSYQRHLRNSLKHVSPQELRFVCDHCNRRFADKTKLRDHIEEKHLHRTYQCPTCMKPSKNRVALDQHIRNVHKGRPNNKMCHHCGRGFPTKLQLESHMRKHTGERPFVCEICPTTFSQKSNLYKHNRQVHLNIKAKRYPAAKKQKGGTEPSDEPPRALIQFDAQRGLLI